MKLMELIFLIKLLPRKLHFNFTVKSNEIKKETAKTFLYLKYKVTIDIEVIIVITF